MAEINRELDVVTDAEERRALVKLFEDWARNVGPRYGTHHLADYFVELAAHSKHGRV